MTLADQTLKFWNAAHFYRGGPRKSGLPLMLTIKVLEQVAADAPERLKDRAITVLVEIDNDHFKRASNI